MSRGVEEDGGVYRRRAGPIASHQDSWLVKKGGGGRERGPPSRRAWAFGEIIQFTQRKTWEHDCLPVP